MLILPRISRKLPTPLIAVAAATLLPVVLGWSRVELLGPLPRQFPMPSLPVVPWDRWNELVMAALALYLLASLESLLSASVVDSLSKSKTTKVDNDQELVGQGLGNLASALFGGLPVTGVIARSATNIQAGARTRLSAIIHAVTLLVMMFGLASLVALIPRAALAGVLIAVALRMIEVHLLRILWRSSRAEAVVFLTTAGAIIVTDLIVGVPVGLAAAFVYVVIEMSKLDVRPVPLVEPESGAGGDGTGCHAVQVMRIDGPLFFASGFHLRSIVNRLNGVRCVVFDMSQVSFLDVTGAEILEEAAEALQRRRVRVLLVHPSESVSRRLRNLSSDGLPTLRTCPVLDTLRDAMRLAANEIGPDSLCRSCQHRGDCVGLTTALEASEGHSENPTPHLHTLGQPVETASN
jgi:SulP family sulfate permease